MANFKLPGIRLRGIRAIIPTGYFLGRSSAGSGDVELITQAEAGKMMVAGGQVSPAGALGTGQNPVFEYLGFSAQGAFATNEQLDLAMVPRSVLFPSVRDTTRDKAICQFAPIADTHFVLTFDRATYLASGTGQLATVTFLAGHKTGTITWTGSRLCSVGDVPWIIFPSSGVDPALAEVQCLFCGDAQ